MTCPTCGTETEQHDKRWHEMAERVVRLGLELHERCDALSDAIGRLEQDALRHTREETSGQSASASEATVPPGWKLAITWHQIDDDDATCDKCDPEEKAAYERLDGNLACAAHAVEMGALVRDEPPAEQSSHPGTSGSVHNEACPVGCPCRDRAKAKAAEHAPKFTQEDARALSEAFGVEPAEPSGTAGFCVVGQSGPGVVQSKGLWIRRARDYRDGSPANGEPRQITMPGSLGGVWDAGEYDILEPIAEPPALAVGTLSARVWKWNTHDDLTRLAADIAALEARLAQAEWERDEWRPRYEAAAADARTLREAWARAERERDEATATAKLASWQKFQASERARWEAMLKRSHDAAENRAANERYEADKREAEAAARERERCLAWAQADVDNGKIAEAISNGAPAPKCDPDPSREVAPDRTQAGRGGQSDDDADEEAMIHDAARLVRRLQRLHPDDGTGSPTNLGWLARYERWRR